MRALEPELPRVLHTESGQTYVRRGEPRSLAPWARASLVSTPTGKGVVIELPAEVLDPEVVFRDRRAHENPGVITALEIGRLAGGGQVASSAYRGSASTRGSQHYALFPTFVGSSLVRSLASARAGRRVPAPVVATLAVEISGALASRDEPGLLRPESVLVSTNGRARLRGALLDHIASLLDAAAPVRIAYLAPELVRRTPQAMDTRGRLFALGLMLAELASGRELLPEHPRAARLLADWGLTIPDLPAEAPGEIRAALWGLLQRDPDRRPQPAMLVDLLATLYEPGLHVATALGIASQGPSSYL